MLRICSIASGSNGNCYYIGNHDEAVLIDAGISARQTLARMKLQNLDPDRIKAIFISHEHADHTSGARVLSKKLNIPVYLTAATYMAMFSRSRPQSPRFFKPGDEIQAGSFTVYPFLKRHDAAEPCSFTIEYNGVMTGVFTDIGSVCENVSDYISRCHVVFLECNYDEQMLWNGKYTWPLKKRIASDYGHLSNDQAFLLVQNCAGKQLHTILLSHLSAENNTPEAVMKRFGELKDKLNIHLTSRHKAGDVLEF